MDTHNIQETDPNDCILWTTSLDSDGYGRMTWHGERFVKAHRVAWMEQVGPIPEGMVIDHLCRTPCCVYVGHLEPVTERENLLRGNGIMAQRARQTECVNGHPFDAENTYLRPTGGRACRECRRAINRRYKERTRHA